jgi:xanthine/uracil/vitamin C permease (AzgA family)
VGIKEGGRTWLVAITVAGCFLVSMFLAPFMLVNPLPSTKSWSLAGALNPGVLCLFVCLD